MTAERSDRHGLLGGAGPVHRDPDTTEPWREAAGASLAGVLALCVGVGVLEGVGLGPAVAADGVSTADVDDAVDDVGGVERSDGAVTSGDRDDDGLEAEGVDVDEPPAEDDVVGPVDPVVGVEVVAVGVDVDGVVVDGGVVTIPTT